MLIRELLSMQASTEVTEQYDTSADFDADMDEMLMHLKAALAIMDTSSWADHVDSTEDNFGNGAAIRATHDALYDAVENAIDAHKSFYETMVEAA